MARPKPTILHSVEINDGSVWDVIQATKNYIITYKDQTCGIRQHNDLTTMSGFRYQKLSYTNLGNAQAQVNRLNKKFDCKDFGIREI